jgi:hypothetical protein
VAGGRTYHLEQVIQSAEFRGELKLFREGWQRIISRAELAAEHDWSVSESVVGQLANDYRYQRDLTSAEDCERWLAARGLGTDDFHGHFIRRYWGQQLADKATSADDFHGNETPERSRLFCVDLLMSDEFDRMARQLAWRVALACEQMAEKSGHEASPRGMSPCVAADGKSGTRLVPITPEWLEEIQRLELAFQAQCQRLLTDENRRRRVASLRLPLLQFELEVLELEAEGAAREAFLCVSHDGMSPAEVAAQGNYPLQQARMFLEELPAEWQNALLSAPPGTVLPPFPRGDGFQVCFLKAKQDPTLEDKQVKRRVDDAILHQHFMDLEARHVQWHIALEVPA